MTFWHSEPDEERRRRERAAFQEAAAQPTAAAAVYDRVRQDVSDTDDFLRLANEAPSYYRDAAATVQSRFAENESFLQAAQQAPTPYADAANALRAQLAQSQAQQQPQQPEMDEFGFPRGAAETTRALGGSSMPTPDIAAAPPAAELPETGTPEGERITTALAQTARGAVPGLKFQESVAQQAGSVLESGRRLATTPALLNLVEDLGDAVGPAGGRGNVPRTFAPAEGQDRASESLQTAGDLANVVPALQADNLTYAALRGALLEAGVPEGLWSDAAALATQMGVPGAVRVVSTIANKMLDGDVGRVAGAVGRAAEREMGQAGVAAAGARGADAALEGEPAPTFYSQAQRVLEQKMPNRAPAAQVRAILSPANGVKPDELKWTGLDDFLAERGTAPVTKQEVTDFLRQNEVRVEEVAKGDGTTRYSQYTLPGGENYRELLLTLPARGTRADQLPAGWRVYGPGEGPGQPTGPGLYRVWGDGDVQGYGETPELAIRQTLADTGRGGASAPFRSGHWDEPNVLAHVRFTDRTGPNGERLLHIEEVQSDWHQKGRQKGYAEPGQFEVRNSSTGERLGTFPTMEDADAFARAHHARTREPINAGASSGVPAAPFAKTWPELALKRMVRWAAEHDYDRIVWTPGAEQAARYDLSKKIGSLYYNPDTGYLVANDFDARPVINQTVRPEGLPDVIGKELTDKLLSAPRVAHPELGSGHGLFGQEMSVGGEGMRGFYDRILPEAAAKLGKKWGAQVGETTLPVDRRNQRLWSLDVTPEMKRSVLAEGQPLFLREGEGGLAAAFRPALARAAQTSGERAFDLGAAGAGGLAGAATADEDATPGERLARGLAGAALGAPAGASARQLGRVAKGAADELAQGAQAIIPPPAARARAEAFEEARRLAEELGAGHPDARAAVARVRAAASSTTPQAVYAPLDRAWGEIQRLRGPQALQAVADMEQALPAVRQWAAGEGNGEAVAAVDALLRDAAALRGGDGSAPALERVRQSLSRLLGRVDEAPPPPARPAPAPPPARSAPRVADAPARPPAAPEDVPAFVAADGSTVQFPRVGALVDGRVVRPDVPNTSSIGAALGDTDYRVLRGIREVPVSAFDQVEWYAANDRRRTDDLARQIAASGELNPLIVAVDADGPYILEGGHRLAALQQLGARSFPAMVVVEEAARPAAAAGGQGGLLGAIGRAAGREGGQSGITPSGAAGAAGTPPLRLSPEGEAARAQMIARNTEIGLSPERAVVEADRVIERLRAAGKIPQEYLEAAPPPAPAAPAAAPATPPAPAPASAQAQGGGLLGGLIPPKPTPALQLSPEGQKARDRIVQNNVRIGIQKDHAAALVDRYIEQLRAAGKIPEEYLAQPPAVTATDWIKALRYNSMLTGPRTFEINVIGNTLEIPWRLARDVGASVGRAAASRSAEPLRELGPEAAGIWIGLQRGGRAALEVLAHGITAQQAARGDVPRAIADRVKNPVAKGLASLLEWPSRGLQAADEIGHQVAYSMAVGRIAAQRATRKGLTGDAWTQEVANQLAAPSPGMVQQGLDAADRMTYKGELGQFGSALVKFTQEAGLLGHIVLPFVKTVYGVTARGIDRSPVGILGTAAELLTKEGRDYLLRGAAKKGVAPRGERLADNAVGGLIGAWFIHQALQGNISAEGPDSPQEKAVLRAQGWQPYAIRVGDQWVSYSNWGPVAAALAQAGSLGEAAIYRNADASLPEMAVDALGRFAGLATEQTYLQGVGAIYRGMTEPDQFGSQFVTSLLGTLIPYGAAINTAAQAGDPVERRAARGDIGEALQRRIPGLRQQLPVARTALGDEQPNPYAGGAALSPLRVTRPASDETATLRRFRGSESAAEDARIARAITRVDRYRSRPKEYPKPSDAEIELWRRFRGREDPRYERLLQLERQRRRQEEVARAAG